MQELIITLRAARINRGLTLKAVAGMTGKHAETISKYEIDSTEIPRDLSLKLLDIYKIPDRNIFFGKESSFHGFESGRKKVKTS